MIIPKIIRYQPNILKSCFLIYDIKNLITITLVIKATNIPTSKIKISIKEKVKPNFNSFNKEAPNITGIAKKNVNSAATDLLTPKISAPTIVAPLLLVPGNIAANN